MSDEAKNRSPFVVRRPMHQEPDPRDPGKAQEIKPILLVAPMMVSRERGNWMADFRPNELPVVEEPPAAPPVQEGEGDPKADSSATDNASPSEGGTSGSGSQITEQTEMSLHPSTLPASPEAPAGAEKEQSLTPPLL